MLHAIPSFYPALLLTCLVGVPLTFAFKRIDDAASARLKGRPLMFVTMGLIILLMLALMAFFTLALIRTGATNGNH